jgi:hypothetical protein
MIEIRDLLLKFNNILFLREIKRESVRSAIFETVGISIKPKDIEIKNSTVYLKIKPIYKNEIFLKQEKVLLLLKKRLGSKAPQSIK